MFITSKYNGYNRDGQQIAAGLFLILMQPHYNSAKYPTHTSICRTCGADYQTHADRRTVPVPTCATHGVIARIKARIAAGVEPNDTDDFLEQFEAGCEACATHNEIVAKIGCTYYQTTAINYPIKAIVRHTSMSQLGQFMMGFARVHGHRITLSGSYGSDGLPCSVPDAVYEYGIELPADLREAWNKGGGWNSAGSEAPLLRKWALANLAALRA